ncbi:sensor domain-containing diguanylate cyclase [Bacillus kwashiorkori]|uniref:sensor domain-containing diguanylate cyclase n=1 Tax=Bacillus kwashiorkori TaxID=1522318 RepID=UPI0007803083|nr:sensor domain-containing diguanylate cyclase [Bacillus kwashiorkori]
MINERESHLLVQFKSDLFENLYVSKEEFLLEKSLNELINKFCTFFQTKNVQFVINKNNLVKDESFFYTVVFESIEFIEDWRLSPFYLQWEDDVNVKLVRGTHSIETLVFLKDRNYECFGVLILDKVNETYSNAFWQQFSATVYHFLQQVFQSAAMFFEQLRLSLLHDITRKFHATMDVDAVLTEITHSLQEIYPIFRYYLYLSNDSTDSPKIPFKLLDYNENDTPAMESYVTGELRKEIQADKQRLYFPLKGKQAVYGVLEISADVTITISTSEIQFISNLAQTAGSAIENAHLYQQSKQLVTDLRLVTKISHQLNRNLNMNEIIKYIVSELKQSFSADEIGFISLVDNEPKILQGSTEYFYDEKFQECFQFIHSRIQRGEDSLFIGDLSKERNGQVQKFLSLMVEPMKQESDIIGYAIVLHKQPYYFSFGTFKLFQSITHHSSLALTNSLLKEELEQLVITDYLTKLYSRNYLDDILHQSMIDDSEGAFVLIDIDNFKKVNDTYGHQVGDVVLIQIAKLIKNSTSKYEISSRWGGEEIAIYLPNRSLEDGFHFAEKLIDLTPKHTSPQVTISCGVSHWQKGDDNNPFKLFKKADEALYYAKRAGKNRACTP